MKILVSGASGLVGSALAPHLERAGHDLEQLSREPGKHVFWNPSTGEVDRRALERFGAPDALIHLAGENIAARRWSAAQKQRIRQSRVEATQKLCQTIRPRVFVGASAIGYYGSRGDEILTEESPPGSGFLAETTIAWENASAALTESGTRVVHLRFGMILAPRGGALAKMLPIFRLGLGGRLGAGNQWLSWIALPDVLRLVAFVLEAPQAQGPFNAVAPNPVRNREFTRALATALDKPAILPVPAFILRLALGEMADGLLLSSQRVLPRRLQSLGFDFHHLEIAPVLRSLLG